MAKAAYWQRGESLDYVNSGSNVIEANTIISLGTRIGIVGTNINPGEKGSVHVTGVYEITKSVSEAITMGTAVYFNGTGITTTASGATPAGYAAQAAGEDDEVVLVKLLG